MCRRSYACLQLQAFFLVSDDVMDSSITRRGQPCWFRLESVGLIAVNDAFMLEACIYYLLKKYFRQDAAYIDLVEAFHEVCVSGRGCGVGFLDELTCCSL